MITKPIRVRRLLLRQVNFTGGARTTLIDYLIAASAAVNLLCGLKIPIKSGM